jgi:transcription initiation factor TFIID TATA-box-binding protein
MVEVVNILATGNLSREIDLGQLEKNLSHSKYKPADFPGLIFRPTLNGTIILFSSGKYSITGVTDEDTIRKLEDNLQESLTELGISLNDVLLANVQNIVCTGNIERELDLSRLSICLGLSNIEYEPEQSPFLVYRPEKENCVMTIASTGKTVITGIKEEMEAEQSFENLLNKICEMESRQ